MKDAGKRGWPSGVLAIHAEVHRAYIGPLILLVTPAPGNPATSLGFCGHPYTS